MKNVSQKDGKGKNICCAIDLHDKSMLAGFAIDKGQISFHQLDTNEKQGVIKLIKLLKKFKKAHPEAEVYVSYEASGAGFRLSDIIEDHGFEVSVLAPSHLPSSQKSRSEKTDKKDVIRIMNVLRSHVLAGADLPAVWKPPAEIRDHREVVRQRVRLGDEITKVKNKIHGLLKRNGIRKPEGTENWTVDHFNWLDRVCEEVGFGCRTTLESLVRELRFYMEEQHKIDRAVSELSDHELYRDQVKAMTRIKGVGLLTAMVFLTELGNLGRFPNRRALACYLGLVPRSYESGEGDDRKGHISRLGPSRLRKILNQSAWAVVRWDDYWGEWFRQRTEIEGLSDKKKKELRKKMITAVMRKLGIRLWHVGLSASSF